MTNHPLTDETLEAIHEDYVSLKIEFDQALRAAADWQLEQVLEYIVANDWFAEPGGRIAELRKAMRPQIVDLPQANSDVCGEEGMERARQQTFEENDELMRLLADS